MAPETGAFKFRIKKEKFQIIIIIHSKTLIKITQLFLSEFTL